MKNYDRTISANLVHAMHVIQSPKQTNTSEATAMDKEISGILIRDAGDDHKSIQFKYGDETYEITVEKHMLVEEGIVCCVEAHLHLAQLAIIMVDDDVEHNKILDEIEALYSLALALEESCK